MTYHKARKPLRQDPLGYIKTYHMLEPIPRIAVLEGLLKSIGSLAGKPSAGFLNLA